jgi:hypothetical protein
MCLAILCRVLSMQEILVFLVLAEESPQLTEIQQREEGSPGFLRRHFLTLTESHYTEGEIV